MSAVIKLLEAFWSQNKKRDEKHAMGKKEPEGIARIIDIPYIDDGNRLHKFDVYYPENITEKLPAIIDIHGGGWMYGDKELNKLYCLNLAAKGFVVFNMSYRLIPEVQTPANQLQDIMKCLEFIGNHINEYPCNGKNFMLTGDSAGGMLSAYTACLLTSEKLRGIFSTVKADIKLTALLLTSPVAFMKASGVMGQYTKLMWDNYKKSPYFNYMDLDEIFDMGIYPPTCLVTSANDFAHPDTIRAAELFKSKGIITELFDYSDFNGKKLNHVFAVLDSDLPEGMDCISKTTDFYKKIIKQSEE